MPFGTGGLYAMERYGVEVTSEDLPYAVEIEVRIVDGVPTCDEVRCRRRPGDPPITSESMRRVPLAGLLRASPWRGFVFRAEFDEDGQIKLLQPVLDPDEEPSSRPPARQRRAITPEHLRDVARVFSEAPTLATVQRRYGVSRATASRWVTAARDQGLITDTDTKESNR